MTYKPLLLGFKGNLAHAIAALRLHVVCCHGGL